MTEINSTVLTNSFFPSSPTLERAGRKADVYLRHH